MVIYDKVWNRKKIFWNLCLFEFQMRGTWRAGEIQMKKIQATTMLGSVTIFWIFSALDISSFNWQKGGNFKKKILFHTLSYFNPGWTNWDSAWIHNVMIRKWKEVFPNNVCTFFKNVLWSSLWSPPYFVQYEITYSDWTHPKCSWRKCQCSLNMICSHEMMHEFQWDSFINMNKNHVYISRYLFWRMHPTN